MTRLFHSLLVSSPNGGGLFAVAGGVTRLLDPRPTTGIHYMAGRFIRAIQAGLIVDYHRGGLTLHEWSRLDLDDVHDVLSHGDRRYVVSTGGNEVVEFDAVFSERARRRFSEAPDSWHLNCLGVRKSGGIFYSAFGCFDATRGYKGADSGTGFIRALRDDEPLVTGLTQPHNILFEESGACLFADSGTKNICRVLAGKIIQSRAVDGYPRGLAVVGEVIYAGLSRSRNIDLGQSDIHSATVLALRRDTFEEIGRVALPANEIYDIRYIDGDEEFDWLCDTVPRI